MGRGVRRGAVPQTPGEWGPTRGGHLWSLGRLSERAPREALLRSEAEPHGRQRHDALGLGLLGT